ncbi:hypothetical protein [Kordia jejudonensis]|uniref:hypothetical protein n=1 Tax=Kordia jejudonensis TaxID=1348245 RepID=UPI0006298DD1|nr:hypothetical protein [Kordia jejudonensis]
MKKKLLKNLLLNKKSISKLTTVRSIIGGEEDCANTYYVCFKTNPNNEINVCFVTMYSDCWQTEAVGCGVPNTQQVDTDTVALC